MPVYRSNKKFTIEETTEMGVEIVKIIGVDDGLVVAVLNRLDFDTQYTEVPEENT